jgi:hypothetical protein
MQVSNRNSWFCGSLLALCTASCGALQSANDGANGPAGAGVQTHWVYHNGEFNWAGDYSWEATINFHDKAGEPVAGRRDIAVTIIGRWGGFQPWVQGKNFDVTPYKYLVYSLKPTVPNQHWSTGFEAFNDVPDGKLLNIVGPPYGPVPVVGKWGTYKIPLSAFELTNTHIQKFTIADGTGLTSNLYYVDDVGFTVE